jgi:NAD(P)-dependent dehydrogenase (short-subunit alcohol dehydrogenase family)/acyl carrier protein
LLEEITAADGEDQIAHRGGARLVARLVRSGFVAAQPRDFSVRADASYLLVGGMGRIGLSLARWMVAQGARHIALAGRSAPSAGAAEAILGMEAQGAEILVLRADASRREDMQAVLAAIGERLPPLAGIVHAANIDDDGELVRLGEAQIERALLPKVHGAFHLDALTRALPLDFFVLHSCAAALLGAPGKGHSAAANAFMDALAHRRAAVGLPAMSIQWGPLLDASPAAAQSTGMERRALRGIAGLTLDEVIEAQERLFSRPRTEVGVMKLFVRQWRELHPRMAGAPFISELRDETPGNMGATGAGQFRKVLEALPPTERLAALERHIAEQLGRVLRLPPLRIDARAPFQSHGLDSLMSLEVKNALELSLGLRLSATLLFTYPNTATLAGHLLGEVLPRGEEAPPQSAPSEAAHAEAVQKVKELSEQEAEALIEAKLLDLGEYLK